MCRTLNAPHMRQRSGVEDVEGLTYTPGGAPGDRFGDGIAATEKAAEPSLVQ